jgi:hypothetical protein
MKTTLLIGVGLSGLLLPGNAMAQEACGNSYMILPDGSCMNMSYLTVMSLTRRNVAAVQQDYNSLYRANLVLDNDSLYRAGESDAERDERFELLAERGIELDDTKAEAAAIEDWLYPIHMQAMMRVNQAYQPRFTRY